MTEMVKGGVTHQRLIALLSQEGANFRVVTHEAVVNGSGVRNRGTALGQELRHWYVSQRQWRKSTCSQRSSLPINRRSEPTRQPYRRITRFVGQPGGSR